MTHSGHVPAGALPGRHWDRFWEKVEPTGFCWEWLGHRNNLGYGGFQIGSRNARAHRIAYELLVGPIPDGLVLDHLCRVRHCVNPDHLEPVTQGENARRGLLGLKRKTHCIRGHLLSEENTYPHKPRLGRQCRPCTEIRSRAKQAKKKINLNGRTPA